jgi:hypothetical protein
MRVSIFVEMKEGVGVSVNVGVERTSAMIKSVTSLLTKDSAIKSKTRKMNIKISLRLVFPNNDFSLLIISFAL